MQGCSLHGWMVVTQTLQTLAVHISVELQEMDYTLHIFGKPILWHCDKKIINSRYNHIKVRRTPNEHDDVEGGGSLGSQDGVYAQCVSNVRHLADKYTP